MGAVRKQHQPRRCGQDVHGALSREGMWDCCGRTAAGGGGCWLWGSFPRCAWLDALPYPPPTACTSPPCVLVLSATGVQRRTHAAAAPGSRPSPRLVVAGTLAVTPPPRRPHVARHDRDARRAAPPAHRSRSRQPVPRHARVGPRRRTRGGRRGSPTRAPHQPPPRGVRAPPSDADHTRGRRGRRSRGTKKTARRRRGGLAAAPAEPVAAAARAGGRRVHPQTGGGDGHPTGPPRGGRPTRGGRPRVRHP